MRTFLNLVPPRVQWSQMLDKPAEILIDRMCVLTFSNSLSYFELREYHRWQVDGVGTVVGGTIMAGQVTAGQNLLMGPDAKGHFTSVTVKSIHVKVRQFLFSSFL
jgi:GTPase